MVKDGDVMNFLFTFDLF
ncbi:hypothetical protein LWU33_07170 [Enterobacter hormaechei]|nr:MULTISPECIES: hypothetical protein [Enterobacter]MCE1275592.1 hypothetical protein [Enterobacter hormaechei]MCE1312102.1 hypothetical protein [Enterobacter hormaechei]MCE1549742.1 hypothetical protein [Enterobacter hormaechei]MCM7454936.1 hypothetical protein [Enterobacter hormaechei]MCM7716941.1 hypothetical protein [Enterobacter hormaechei]